MFVFLDANAVIYLLEGAEPFGSRVRAALQELSRHHPTASMAMSRLSWLECRVGPLRRKNTELLARYDAFFVQSDLIWIELDRQVVELATQIRAHHALRTPDSLQAACCLQLGPEHAFVTGDAAFQRVSGLNVCLLA